MSRTMLLSNAARWLPDWGLLSRFVAVVLLTAAVLKSGQLASGPMAETSLLTSRWVVVLGVQVEWGLGLWLLSGYARDAARQAAIVLLAGLSFVALTLVMAGAKSCGCFGAVQVPPAVTLALDLTALALLFAVPASGPAEPRSNQTSPRLGWAAGYALSAVALGVAGWWPEIPFGRDTRGRTQVLRPESWVGQRLPLLDHLSGADGQAAADLAAGRWALFLVRHDCEHCRELLPRFREEVKRDREAADGRRSAIVLIGPPGSLTEEWEAGFDTAALLDPTRRWFARTPCRIELDGGRVNGIEWPDT